MAILVIVDMSIFVVSYQRVTITDQFKREKLHYIHKIIW